MIRFSMFSILEMLDMYTSANLKASATTCLSSYALRDPIQVKISRCLIDAEEQHT